MGKTYKFKFDIGDRVLQIHSYRRQYLIICEACEGEGRIPLKNGDTTQCPKCWGRDAGHITKYESQKWQILPDMLTVGQQRVEVERTRTEEIYMCEESGIRSGTLHSVENLFLLELEAQEKCDELNATTKED